MARDEAVLQVDDPEREGHEEEEDTGHGEDVTYRHGGDLVGILRHARLRLERPRGRRDITDMSLTGREHSCVRAYTYIAQVFHMPLVSMID